MLNKDNVRELAYIVKVDAIEPIEVKDRVEAAVIGGWRTMVRKGLLKPGDLGIYIEIDSQTPEVEPFKLTALIFAINSSNSFLDNSINFFNGMFHTTKNNIKNKQYKSFYIIFHIKINISTIKNILSPKNVHNYLTFCISWI